MDNKSLKAAVPEIAELAPFIERRGAARMFEQPAGPDVTFGAIWRILRKRKWLVLGCACGVFAAAAAYTFTATPRYRTTSVIEFEKSNTDSLEVDERAGMPGGANTMDYTITQRTQVAALESDTLALQVVHDLNLESRKEFSGHSVFDYLRHEPDESTLPLERAPYRMARVLKAYHKSLRVDSISGTRMISIQFLSPDPQLSAKIVNSLVSDYTDQYFKIRYTATVQASDWLSQQLNELKTQVEASEQKLADYQRQAGILGTDETHNIVMTRLEQINEQLTTAQANRILAQAVWQLAQTGNPELLPGLVNVTTSAGSSTTSSSLALIGALRAQQNEVKMELAEDTAKYGSAYPKLIELQSKVDAINGSIQTEISNLATRAHNDYLAAQQTQDDLRSAFEKAKLDANEQNDAAVQYTILKHEAESRRSLYDSLSQRLQEAGVLANLRSSNIVVMDPARPSDRPARPIVPLNLGLGLVGGLMIGVMCALVADNLDETISSPELAEEVSMVPSLGFVPRWKRLLAVKKNPKANGLTTTGSGVLVLKQPHSLAAEAYRGLRTSIMQSMRVPDCNVLLFTSAFPDEGKTTTIINCAAAFAQQGLRVLLVEADLRRPNVCSQLNINSATGLSSLISSGPSTGLPVKLPNLPHLSVIPSGPRAGYPAELLGSHGTQTLIAKWRSEYDYVFIDTPPVLSVTDAAVLAPFCDGVIVVLRSGITSKKSLLRTMEVFRRTQTRIVGTILNAFDIDSVEYHNYFGYKPTAENGNGYYIPENN